MVQARGKGEMVQGRDRTNWKSDVVVQSGERGENVRESVSMRSLRVRGRTAEV